VCDLQDIDDLQNFACKHKVDFVAASFVQSKEDVLFIRKTLDDAGGQDIKIISKIENMAGLENFDGAYVTVPAPGKGHLQQIAFECPLMQILLTQSCVPGALLMPHCKLLHAIGLTVLC